MQQLQRHETSRPPADKLAEASPESGMYLLPDDWDASCAYELCAVNRVTSSSPTWFNTIWEHVYEKSSPIPSLRELSSCSPAVEPPTLIPEKSGNFSRHAGSSRPWGIATSAPAVNVMTSLVKVKKSRVSSSLVLTSAFRSKGVRPLAGIL